jgi:hypothetical protein
MMPAESQAQRSYLYATKGAAWVKAHHFDNKGKLPMKKAKKTGPLDKVSAVRNTSDQAKMEAKAAKGLKAAFPSKGY